MSDDYDRTGKGLTRPDTGNKSIRRLISDVGKSDPQQEVEYAEKEYYSKQITKMSEPRWLMPNELEAKRIIYPEMGNRDVADVFRELRTKLLQVSDHSNFVTMITSVIPKGGSSFVALNLATAFSFDEAKTALLIDCNLRNPSIDKLLELDFDYGLTDFLEDRDLQINDIIYSSGIQRLRVIPVGQSRETSEFYTSVRMRSFLNVVRQRYPDRFIIIDAPSISNSADARILAELCDFAILVVPYGRVTEKQIITASNEIGRDKLAGVVLNN